MKKPRVPEAVSQNGDVERGGRAVSCSILIPVRNEEGNIAELLSRIPEFGTAQEVLLIEGGSKDGTWMTIQRELARRSDARFRAWQQVGMGKGNAVKEGLAACQGEWVFILDGDLSIDPRRLQECYDLVQEGGFDFLNGTRFVCPMEKDAMPFLNRIANRGFTWLWRIFFGLPVTDSLCGIKVFRRADFVTPGFDFCSVRDPFGDFALLLGAAIQDLRIREVAMPYLSRRYGRSNISRWRDGWRLLKLFGYAWGFHWIGQRLMSAPPCLGRKK